MRQGDGCAIVGIEAFSFNHALAHDAKSTFTAVLLRMSVSSAGPVRRRKKPNGAVCKHTINIEQDKFYLLGAVNRHSQLRAASSWLLVFHPASTLIGCS